MFNSGPTGSKNFRDRTQGRKRRVLIVAEQDAGFLQQRFVDSGFDTHLSTADDADHFIREFAPDALVVEIDQETEENEEKYFSLARRLRAEAATYALPLVFVYHEDKKALRNFALQVGADDYFALNIPRAELHARMDALFWRVDAGRRAASVIGDQRIEIDNFMVMLEAVRADVRAGLSGTIAVVSAAGEAVGRDKTERDRVLSEAYGFLKLNLRRADAVAFYGPTTLLVYLPRLTLTPASQSLNRLRAEFDAGREESRIALGLASFPEDGTDLEGLIARAEMAAGIKDEIAAQSGDEESGVEEPEGSAEALAADEELGGEARTLESPESKGGEYQEREAASSGPDVSEILTEANEGEGALSSTQSLFRQAHEIEHGTSYRHADEYMEAEAAAEVEPAESHREERTRRRRGETDEQAAAEMAARAAEAAAVERERRASGAIMPRRLLLTVSDGARMVQINSLIRAAGYEARAAFDGQQALDLLRIERPDLLLLDYELQGMDGLEMLRRLRKQGGGRLNLPVVMLLSPENESERREALELGAHSVVSMPYDPFELLDSVRVAGKID